MSTIQFITKTTRFIQRLTAACVLGAWIMTACSTLQGTQASATPTVTITMTRAPTATARPTPTPAPTDTPAPTETPTPTQVVLVGAGDISNCGNPGAGITASLLDQFPAAAIFTAGDNSNVIGTPNEFKLCFGTTWGRYKDRIHPAVGEHEYYMKGASGYFDYFGAAAGEPGKGWYSYDLGGWHIVVLNSECSKVGGCEAGSAQEKWLKADLTAHHTLCSMAVWHVPFYSAALAQGLPFLQDIWKDLYAAGVELVVNAHHNDYERFAPMDPQGKADETRGIREFIVGTGGAPLEKGEHICSGNCQVINHTTLGVLKLTLRPDGYDWQFVPQPGKILDESGSGVCHN